MELFAASLASGVWRHSANNGVRVCSRRRRPESRLIPRLAESQVVQIASARPLATENPIQVSRRAHEEVLVSVVMQIVVKMNDFFVLSQKATDIIGGDDTMLQEVPMFTG